MIPRRVKLAGFLSYKDEQEIDFGEASLWMLAGTNGSGKSSVFDALTYALFGHHRGGSQNAVELINKESNSLSVEFDFTLEGELYRVKRTLRRNPRGGIAGTQQVFTQAGSSNGESGWQAVPDTNKKVDFDRWILDKIGLNYETFTSSVLLLQGKAEKLLDARPSGRAEVLAGIVDLERYQRLYDKANARKLECKARLEAISHQTDAVPEISDLELSGAILKIEECEAARETIKSRLDATMGLEVQARRWVDLQARLLQAEQRLATSEQLLGEAVKIEKRYARWQELRDVLPAVNTVLTMHGQALESQRKTDHYTRHREEALLRKQSAEHEKEQVLKQRQSLQAQLARDEQKLSGNHSRLRELTGILEKARLIEEQLVTQKRLEDELARLPNEPSQAVRSAQETLEKLQELHRILPILERFQTERHELETATTTERDTHEQLLRLQKDGQAAKQELIALQQEWKQAQQARTTAEQDAAVSKTLLDQATAAVESFKGLSGSPNCSACGQALTPQHFKKELQEREATLKQSTQRHITASKTLEAAISAETTLAQQVQRQTEAVQSLREQYQQIQTQGKQASGEIKRLSDSLALRYAEMPEVYRLQISPQAVSDWATTQFPERDQLAVLRREANTLDAAKRLLRESLDQETKWKDLRARLESVQQTVQRIQTTLPSTDVTALRQESQKLQLEESTLIQAIKTAKLNLQQLELTADKLGRDAHDAVHTITELVGKLHTEEVVRKNCADNSERAMQNLPSSWAVAVQTAGMAEYSGWQSEFEELLADGIEAKAKQLESARVGLETLRETLASLQAEADSTPAEARRTPEQILAMIQAVRQELELADKSLRDAQRDKALLDGYREQRAKLGDQFRKLDAEHNRYKQLAELLGRDRLQRFLVRQAERQIVDYANAVLDRLSGGQLFLKLASNEDGSSGTEKALDLDCYNRTTGGAPINVSFLSGSQKFRVAVSLALAIGQYASKQHRPIESVIIDEGFGCLDRQGRQVMIQELQNLRGHLHCILLVSHQEEFADAFTHGYRFELHNGATRINRVQR